MRLDVEFIHGRPYHPQTQGKDECFHRTGGVEVLQGRSFADAASLQEALDPWRQVYNNHRPHESPAHHLPGNWHRHSVSITLFCKGQAPVLQAMISIKDDLPGQASACVEVAGMVFETRMTGLGELEVFNRPPAALPSFAQMGIEAAAGSVSLKVNGKPVDVIIPPTGISGGPAAIWAPAGIYTR